MEERYLIIADDFTGANDTGVQLRRRGFPTEVLFAGKPVGTDYSVVIDTESRTIPPQDAYEKVLHAAEQIDFSGFRYVIKKIDSTVRGNIAQEVLAVDQQFHPELIVFAPALPNLGRTTVNGVQCLNGVEICQTELAKDPKNPVTEDNLVRMLQAVYEEPVQLKALSDVRAEELTFADGRIFACDAQTNEDLQKILKAVQASGRKTLYIGTAGLADNLMALEHASLPALAIVASVSSVTNRQMQHCEKAGIHMVQVPTYKILRGEETIDAYVQDVIRTLQAGEDAIFLADTSYDREALALSYQAGEDLGMTKAEVGDKVRDMIGEAAREILENSRVAGVYVTGGDTALGMLERIGADGSEILQEILVGIPMIRVRGGEFDGLKLVTKAGAFGADDAAAFALRKLKETL